MILQTSKMGTACKATNLEGSDEEDLEINVDEDSQCESEIDGANGFDRDRGFFEEPRGFHSDRKGSKPNNCDINGYVSDHNSNNTKSIKGKSLSDDEKHFEKIRRQYERAENLIRNYKGDSGFSKRIGQKCGDGKTDSNSEGNQSEYEDIGSRSNSPKTYLPNLMRGKADDRSDSGSPLETSTSAVLPFSISRLLSREKRHSHEEDDRHSDRTTPSPRRSADEKSRPIEAFEDSALGLYPHPALVQFAAGGLNASSRIPGFLYNTSAGVIRVPAHRPPLAGALPAPPGAPAIPTLGSPFPWLAAMDPSFQRSAAAAAFASQVVKERLSGKSIPIFHIKFRCFKFMEFRKLISITRVFFKFYFKLLLMIDS